MFFALTVGLGLSLTGPPASAESQPEPPPASAPNTDSSKGAPTPDKPTTTDTAAPVLPREFDISIGARVVLRPEARSGESFGATPNDSSWRIRQGVRLSVDLRYRFARTVVEVQDVRDWGDGATTLSVQESVSAHQAFVEFSGSSLGKRARTSTYLRLGRQEVTLWSRRLLGQSPWQPASRAFDAARGRVDVGRFGVELGAIMLRAPRTFTVGEVDALETRRTRGEQLYWGEASFDAHTGFRVHLASLLLRQDGSESRPDRDRTILSPGAYITGTPVDGFTYELEGYYQYGRDGDARHRAWAASATAGYVFDAAMKPTLRASYEIATGSACTNATGDPDGCGAAVVGDFEQFVGARHLYRGHADLFGMINMRDLHLRASFSPDETLLFLTDYHHLSLHEARGAWRNTGANLVGLGWDPDNTTHTLGHEIDFLVDYRPIPAIRLRPGYALFVPAGAGRTLGGDRTQHFVYIWLIAKIGYRFKSGPKPQSATISGPGVR